MAGERRDDGWSGMPRPHVPESSIGRLETEIGAGQARPQRGRISLDREGHPRDPAASFEPALAFGSAYPNGGGIMTPRVAGHSP